MPWSETTKMRERMKFVVDAEGELFTMTELCERYGISRMTGHKWVRRFRQDGVGALRAGVGRRCIALIGPMRRSWKPWSMLDTGTPTGAPVS
jgi:transposase